MTGDNAYIIGFDTMLYDRVKTAKILQNFYMEMCWKYTRKRFKQKRENIQNYINNHHSLYEGFVFDVRFDLDPWQVQMIKNGTDSRIIEFVNLMNPVPRKLHSICIAFPQVHDGQGNLIQIDNHMWLFFENLTLNPDNRKYCVHYGDMIKFFGEATMYRGKNGLMRKGIQNWQIVQSDLPYYDSSGALRTLKNVNNSGLLFKFDGKNILHTTHTDAYWNKRMIKEDFYINEYLQKLGQHTPILQ